MESELDSQMSHLLRQAAEKAIAENEFYRHFRDWYREANVPSRI